MATSWHLTSVAVLGGALHGKKHDIEDVVVEVLIGSDPDCHLHLDLPSVSPIHARLWIEPDDVTVYGTRSGPGVFVNFDRVDGEAKLAPGDMLWLGPPQAAGSVMLQARFEERDSLPPALAVAVADEGAADSATAPDAAVAEAPPVSLSADALGFDAPVEPPIPLALSVTADEPPVAARPAEEPAGGFDEFLVMAQVPPAEETPVATAASDEFIVSGFEAEWPEESAPSASAPELASFAIAAPVMAAPVMDDVDDAFFVADDGSMAPPLPAVPPPAPDPPPRKASVVTAQAPLVPKPTAPPLPKPAATAPPVVVAPAPAAAAPPKAPARETPPLAPPAAAAGLPMAGPNTTGAIRPARRPDVSQQVPRGDRPAAPRPERTIPPRSRAKAPSSLGRNLALGVVALVVLGGGAWLLTGGVSVSSVTPARARVGETVVVAGKGFATEPGANTVLFGDKPANVQAATATRLDVVVPDVVPAGAEQATPLRVKVGRSESGALEVAVYSGPVLHGISPDVAMPGDEVVLAGSAWGPAPSVRFGGLPADVLETKEMSLRVRVPLIEGGSGTAAPVVVASGTLESNPGPFFVGRIPLVTKAEPTTVSPGDVITVSGRGFRRERVQNVVDVGGVRALVVSALDSEIKVVVPRVAPGSRVLDVRVPSSVGPTQVALVVSPGGPNVEFRFVAEPFEAAPGRDHAVVATGLGPAFVLASSGGQSAAERAVQAAQRLNEALVALQASADLNVSLRNPDSNPELGLPGRPEVILEVTAEDATAYGEDWTRARGGLVTRGRLARWWEAVAKDLVLLLVRGQGPHFAADLAPEGRVFQEVFQASRRSGGAGVPAEALAQARPAVREGLRNVAFRVPAAVRAPEGVAAVEPRPAGPSPSAPASTATTPMPRLEGAWSGTESESGRLQYVTATFRGNTGTLSFEGALGVSAPMLSVDQPQRGAARFSVELRGGLRYYSGRWNGQALVGKISSDPGSAQALGTFELRPPR
jgi:hypothetical protein